MWALTHTHTHGPCARRHADTPPSQRARACDQPSPSPAATPVPQYPLSVLETQASGLGGGAGEEPNDLEGRPVVGTTMMTFSPQFTGDGTLASLQQPTAVIVVAQGGPGQPPLIYRAHEPSSPKQAVMWKDATPVIARRVAAAARGQPLRDRLGKDLSRGASAH